jgi:hypothetical protein
VGAGGDRIRVGFVSSGFGNHPTGLLIVDLIERLRDGPLETVAFATTDDEGGAIRARLRSGFAEFHECAASIAWRSPSASGRAASSCCSTCAVTAAATSPRCSRCGRRRCR